MKERTRHQWTLIAWYAWVAKLADAYLKLAAREERLRHFKPGAEEN
jgi:hypothetical protein